jgi:hypothetical protein
MIATHDFKEAYQQYQCNIIPYRLLQEQALVLLEFCSKPYLAVTYALDISDGAIQWLLQQKEATAPYLDFQGGNVFVCETEDDLKHILGCDFEWAEAHDGRWPNVMDIPMSWDVCSYLDEAEGEPQWVIFLLCWNNAGGPVYYIPNHLWQAARVIEHIAATNNAWNS